MYCYTFVFDSIRARLHRFLHLAIIMITRRNWLLRCSILINVAVLLYICSQVMIDTNSNDMAMYGNIGVQQQDDLQRLVLLQSADVKSNINGRRDLKVI